MVMYDKPFWHFCARCLKDAGYTVQDDKYKTDPELQLPIKAVAKYFYFIY